MYMERNKEIGLVRPFARPNKPSRRISLWRYPHAVYRKNIFENVSSNSNFLSV